MLNILVDLKVEQQMHHKVNQSKIFQLKFLLQLDYTIIYVHNYVSLLENFVK